MNKPTLPTASVRASHVRFRPLADDVPAVVVALRGPNLLLPFGEDAAAERDGHRGVLRRSIEVVHGRVGRLTDHDHPPFGESHSLLCFQGHERCVLREERGSVTDKLGGSPVATTANKLGGIERRWRGEPKGIFVAGIGARARVHSSKLC